MRNRSGAGMRSYLREQVLFISSTLWLKPILFLALELFEDVSLTFTMQHKHTFKLRIIRDGIFISIFL